MFLQHASNTRNKVGTLPLDKLLERHLFQKRPCQCDKCFNLPFVLK